MNYLGDNSLSELIRLTKTEIANKGGGSGTIDIDLEGATEGETNLVNADTLGGNPPEYYLNINSELGTNGVEIVKLWENASLTSDFAAQTVSVDLTGYDLIFVTGTSEPGTSNRLHLASSFVPNIVGNIGVIFETYTDFWEQVREFRIVSNGVQFSNASIINHVSDDHYSDWASRAIPTAIYGIKGVTA